MEQQEQQTGSEIATGEIPAEGATVTGVTYERTAGAAPSTNGDRPRGLLNRDTLLRLSRKTVAERIRKVELPWLGEDAYVYVLPMSARDKDAFEKSLVKGKGKKRVVTEDNIRARIIVRCVVNADGSRILMDGDAEDLGGLDGQSADAIFTVAATDSGITDDDVEQLAKN